MADTDTSGRANQKRRTRKELLQAAARLLKRGITPNLEEIAQEAMVSRATAYRYFPSVEALHHEAALDVSMPEPEAIFAGMASTDAVQRMERVDASMHDLFVANDAPFRMMLAHALQRGVNPGADPALPIRQNRRSPLIDAALAPSRDQFSPAMLKTLSRALALIVGTEAMIVFKDVLQMDEAEARKVKRWAIRALVEAARKPQSNPNP